MVGVDLFDSILFSVPVAICFHHLCSDSAVIYVVVVWVVVGVFDLLIVGSLGRFFIFLLMCIVGAVCIDDCNYLIVRFAKSGSWEHEVLRGVGGR